MNHFVKSDDIPASSHLHRAFLHDGCIVGAGSVLTDCTVGNNVKVQPHCTFLGKVLIGSHCHIGEHVTLPSYSKLGQHTVLGANATLGDFSSVGSNTVITKGCAFGNNITIGGNTTIVESTIGSNTVIGPGSRLTNSSVGKHSMLTDCEVIGCTLDECRLDGAGYYRDSIILTGSSIESTVALSDSVTLREGVKLGGIPVKRLLKISLDQIGTLRLVLSLDNGIYLIHPQGEVEAYSSFLSRKPNLSKATFELVIAGVTALREDV